MSATCIRELRLARGLSQRELAELTGMTKANVSRVENGRQHYTQRSIESIAAALKVPPSALLLNRSEPLAAALPPAADPYTSQLSPLSEAGIRRNLVARSLVMLTLGPEV